MHAGDILDSRIAYFDAFIVVFPLSAPTFVNVCRSALRTELITTQKQPELCAHVVLKRQCFYSLFYKAQ